MKGLVLKGAFIFGVIFFVNRNIASDRLQTAKLLLKRLKGYESTISNLNPQERAKYKDKEILIEKYINKVENYLSNGKVSFKETILMISIQKSLRDKKINEIN